MTEEEKEELISERQYDYISEIYNDYETVGHEEIVNAFHDCYLTDFFGREGGLFTCNNGGGIDIWINSIKFPEFKAELTISTPEEKDIRATLHPDVPYAGAILIDLQEPNIELPANITEDDMRFVVHVPLKSKLSPGTKLEVFLKGESYGVWRREAEYPTALVDNSGLIASFEPKFQAFGLFIVRKPDHFSIPSIDLDSIFDQLY